MTPSLLLTRLALELRTRFRDDERGASTVEYALVVVAVAGFVLTLMAVMGDKLTDWFDTVEIPPAGGEGGAGGAG